jgi:hypothetical protein
MARSARGLFWATGKTANPVMIGLVDNEAVMVDALVREQDDFYPTPPEPIRALLSVEDCWLRKFPSIWEPAAGDGAMVFEIEACGHKVVASDLIDRGCSAEIKSFYDYSVPASQCIVTNPPFNECNVDPGWVRHALETLRVEYMALLLPLNWLGAVSRAALWDKYPPSRVYLMRWRIDFTGQGASPMLNAWFVWHAQTQEGQTRLLMLDRKDARQFEMFGEAS